MKKSFTLISLLIFVNGMLPVNNSIARTDTGYYVVTAYYSPLPDQEKYLTGNYESEKRLNGQGIAGASGEGVFSGMLAAPQSYEFGTKIYIEGLGVGVVEDRGGAIVPAGQRGYSHDRIDVWMGYGDEGLQRALYWGKRTVEGRVVDENTQTTFDYDSVLSPNWATDGLNSQSDVFNYSIGVGYENSKVEKLQELLIDTGFYDGEIDGFYDREISDIVYNFQINNGVISSGADEGAGYWGIKTRTQFKKMFLNGEFDQNQIEELDIGKNNLEEEKNIEPENNPEPKPEKLEEKNYDLSLFDSFVNTSQKVRNLQEIMTHLGFYNGEISGKYSDIRESIYDYQLENNIVNNKDNEGAGNFGPKTRASMKNTYVNFSEKLEQEKILEEQKKYNDNRREELEKKFRELEKYAEEESKQKTDYIGTLYKGTSSARVRDLQLLLKDFGFFNHVDTAYYGDITAKSVMDFQIANSLVRNANDPGAGTVGPKTLEVMKYQYKKKLLLNEIRTNHSDIIELASLSPSI